MLAVVVHAFVIALLVVGFRWQFKSTPDAGDAKKVVQAMTVDDAQVQREVERLKQEEARKRAQEAARLKQMQDEQAKAAAAQRARQAEEAHLAQLKQQAAAEKKRQAAQRAVELAKQRQAEAARQAAAEAQARRQKEAEAALKQQLAAEEQARQAAAQAAAKAATDAKAKAVAQARALSQADRYKALIKQKVERNWVRPPSAAKGLQCVVRVRLLAGGDVVAAKVIQSSGNAVFDRSVESAVFKAAPLPVPSDPQVFDYFRELDFVFNPQD